jgi:hypothetical protein
MDDEQRSRFFNALNDEGQTELMDSYARSAKVTRNGNVINRFRGGERI